MPKTTSSLPDRRRDPNAMDHRPATRSSSSSPLTAGISGAPVGAAGPDPEMVVATLAAMDTPSRARALGELQRLQGNAAVQRLLASAGESGGATAPVRPIPDGARQHISVQRVKIYGNRNGGEEEVGDVTSKTQMRELIKGSSDLKQLRGDLETSLGYYKEGTDNYALLTFGIELVEKKLGTAAPKSPAAPPDTSMFSIQGKSLKEADDLLAVWEGAHEKSKGKLIKEVRAARTRLANIVGGKEQFAAHHADLVEVVTRVRIDNGEKGLQTSTDPRSGPSSPGGPRPYDFGACADRIIRDISRIGLGSNRGLDMVEPPAATTKNAQTLFEELSRKYHGQPAAWAGENVRYYIVRGAVTKIDITGHQWSHDVDRSLETGTNVFNYHLNW